MMTGLKTQVFQQAPVRSGKSGVQQLACFFNQILKVNQWFL
jgi:hypothetical protein